MKFFVFLSSGNINVLLSTQLPEVVKHETQSRFVEHVYISYCEVSM